MTTARIVDRGKGYELLIRRSLGDMYIPIDPEEIKRLMRSCEYALSVARREAREWR